MPLRVYTRANPPCRLNLFIDPPPDSRPSSPCHSPQELSQPGGGGSSITTAAPAFEIAVDESLAAPSAASPAPAPAGKSKRGASGKGKEKREERKEREKGAADKGAGAGRRPNAFDLAFRPLR
jgi:hypothetical protein